MFNVMFNVKKAKSQTATNMPYQYTRTHNITQPLKIYFYYETTRPVHGHKLFGPARLAGFPASFFQNQQFKTWKLVYGTN